MGSHDCISGCLSACNGDEVIVQHISQHGKTWPYWFRKMGQSVAASLLFIVVLSHVLLSNNIAVCIFFKVKQHCHVYCRQTMLSWCCRQTVPIITAYCNLGPFILYVIPNLLLNTYFLNYILII